MYCSNCGKEIDASCNYCPYCGNLCIHKNNSKKLLNKFSLLIILISLFLIIAICVFAFIYKSNTNEKVYDEPTSLDVAQSYSNR